jgi:choice-of-anchor C domain-containing protein
MKHPIARAGVALGVLVLLILGVLAAKGTFSGQQAQQGADGQASSSQLVGNGSFETPKVSKVYDTFAPSTKLGPWRVGGGPVDVVGSYWKSASGGQSLNLRGGEVRPWIWQEIKTEPGKMYVLKFALSGNPDGAPRDKKIEVWWDDDLLDTVTFGVESIDHKNMGWKYINYNVTAQTGVSRLRFSSGVDQPWGPAIDDVTLTPAK